MKIIVYLLFIISVISCCKTESNIDNVTYEGIKKSETKETPPTRLTDNQSESFNVSEFKLTLDSFLSNFTNEQIKYRLTIDTVDANLHRKILNDTALLSYLVNNSLKVIHYSFEDKESTEDLDFRIIEIQFIDSSQCNKVFKKLVKYANTKESIDNFKYVPCLTYQNDFLQKGRRKIFWIDNSCRFSYKLHKNYFELFNKTLVNFIPLDSIVCECGGVTSVN